MEFTKPHTTVGPACQPDFEIENNFCTATCTVTFRDLSTAIVQFTTLWNYGDGHEDTLGYLRANRVGLVGRYGKRCEDSDDRYDDHQLDERKTAILRSHDSISLLLVLRAYVYRP